MLRGILFDLGDTLLDFPKTDNRAVAEEASRATYEYLLARRHRLPEFAKYFRMQYGALRLALVWSWVRRRELDAFGVLRRMCRKMRLDLGEEGLRELAWQWYLPMTRLSTVAGDVIPTLTRFRDRGLKLAIVSNTFIPGFVLDRHVAMHDLLEFFPTRIYSSEVEYQKPHPKIFQIALRELNLRPSEAVFVGNVVKTDIVGARNAGMVTVLRDRLAETRTHRTADHVVRSLTELNQILPLLGAPPASEYLDEDVLVWEGA